MHRCAGFIALFALAAASPAGGEARLTAKGDTLRGEVVEIGPKGVTFSPVQGEGTILVPWADVEAIDTTGTFFVMYGDDGELRGRLVGVDDGHLLIGGDPETAERVETAAIYAGFAEDGDGLSGYDRLKSRFRHWSASLDAGALYVDADTDQLGGHVAFRAERDEDPWRLLLEGAARYAAQDQRGAERDVTENVVWGLVRGERELAERLFAFASNRATYDEIQHLSLRLEPRAGVGVRIVESERFNLSGDVGAAWVYEDYFGSTVEGGVRQSRGSDDYWAVAFGAQADAVLPYGVIWRARAEYLPAIDDWTRDYLLRGETSLEFPLLEWLALKLALADEYDNTPGEDSVRNRFTSTAALSLRF